MILTSKIKPAASVPLVTTMPHALAVQIRGILMQLAWILGCATLLVSDDAY